MIKTIKHIIIISIILIYSSGALYSDNKKDTEYIIFDKSAKHPVLKNIYECGYFDDLSTNVKYDANKNEGALGLNNIIVYSNHSKKDNKDYMEFSIVSKNRFNQYYRLFWKFPAEDAQDLFEDDPTAKIFNIAGKCKERDVNAYIQELAMTPNSISGLNPIYATNKQGSHIKGYDFTVRSAPPHSPRFWRAFFWVVFANSLGVGNYWLNKHENMEDWEYLPTKEDMWKKVTDGWSLDTNAFRTNTIYHIYAGIIYYQAGRNSGYGILGSSLWSIGGSLLWEYVGEYREQVSSNDMIFTPLGGIIMGEAFIETGIYLEKKLPDWFIVHFVLFLLDPIRKLNKWIDYWTENEIDVKLQFLNPASLAIQKGVFNHTPENIGGGVILRW